MIYRKLKRTWSNGSVNYIPNFKKVFPELSKLNNDELCDRFAELNMDFYYKEKTPVKPLIRVTLPFALILMVLMVLYLPINFIITGRWGYPIGNKNRILNWFKSLGFNV